jgi:hypothetical protein
MSLIGAEGKWGNADLEVGGGGGGVVKSYLHAKVKLHFKYDCKAEGLNLTFRCWITL